MTFVFEFFAELLELFIGRSRRRNQSATTQNADIVVRLIGAAIVIALAVAIFIFWATIVSFAIIAFWIAVVLGLVIGVVKFFAD